MTDTAINTHFLCQCIFDILDGLAGGLSRFSHPSRVALLYALAPDDPVRVCDPQHMLVGHEPVLKSLYLDSDAWRRPAVVPAAFNQPDYVIPERNLDLAGLISYGGRTRQVAYQMWFTEHHPDMCAVGPTERWLEHAVWRLGRDLMGPKGDFCGISGAFLKEYGTHAVRDCIVDEVNMTLGMDSQVRIYPLLDAILGISRTREEGAWARGDLLVVEPALLPQVSMMMRFPKDEQPMLEHHKHVRKLLQAVERSNRKLVSDGRSLVGITARVPSVFHLAADFRGQYGFLKIRDTPICSFADGRFGSRTYQAKLVQVEEALLETHLSREDQTRLFKIVAELVHSAQARNYGCSIVLDLRSRIRKLPGHTPEPLLDLRTPRTMSLAHSLAKVDGALHIGKDLKLHGFACLLDGRTISGEDRSRGARYNSALRFTADKSDMLVVVVSADQTVAVIQEGVETSAQCRLGPVSVCTIEPPTLEEWIAANSQ